MKRLIFLKADGPKEREAALKTFQKEAKELSLKVVKEFPKVPSVLIEFEDDRLDEVYNKLRVLDVVEVIDSILPKSE